MSDASYTDPWSAQTTPSEAQEPSTWTDWGKDPRNRQALLQFGLQLMQPVGLGQTGAGHLAQSLGAAGEQVTRGDAEEEKSAMAATRQAMADEQLQRQRQQPAAGLSELVQRAKGSPQESGTPQVASNVPSGGGVRPPPVMSPLDPNARTAGMPSSRGPNEAQIATLRANPNLAAQFDAKFGIGASKKYLLGA